MTAIEDIAAERRRQIEAEGWSPSHDDGHLDGELAAAACCYADPHFSNGKGWPPEGWPWSEDWWKPKTRRHDLVKAGALIAAEIDRIDRAAKTSG